MLKAYIDPRRCLACPECPPALVCTAKAIARIEIEDPPFVELNYCHGCGDCVEPCIAAAISMRET